MLTERESALAAGISEEDKQASPDGFTASVVTPRGDEMLLKNASNTTIALSCSLDNAICSRGCEGDDAGATYWCKNCDQALCSPCAIRHTRSHVLSELAVLRAQQDLQEKLSRVRETSLEQRRRSKAQEEKIEREKQELSSQIKAEEKRLFELMKEAAAFRSKEERRLRELDEEAGQIKAAAEEEARRIHAEEDELVVQKQRLEDELSGMPFHSVLNTTTGSGSIGHVEVSITSASPTANALPSPQMMGAGGESAGRESAAAATFNALAFLDHLVDVRVERNSQGAVGMVFSLQQGSDKCVVTSLKPGSPASGVVAPGDRIYYVDGKPVAGLSTAELMGIIKGDAFSRVTFTIAPGDIDVESLLP